MVTTKCNFYNVYYVKHFVIIYLYIEEYQKVKFYTLYSLFYQRMSLFNYDCLNICNYV